MRQAQGADVYARVRVCVCKDVCVCVCVCVRMCVYPRGCGAYKQMPASICIVKVAMSIGSILQILNPETFFCNKSMCVCLRF